MSVFKSRHSAVRHIKNLITVNHFESQMRVEYMRSVLVHVMICTANMSCATRGADGKIVMSYL